MWQKHFSHLFYYWLNLNGCFPFSHAFKNTINTFVFFSVWFYYLFCFYFAVVAWINHFVQILVRWDETNNSARILPFNIIFLFSFFLRSLVRVWGSADLFAKCFGLRIHWIVCARANKFHYLLTNWQLASNSSSLVGRFSTFFDLWTDSGHTLRK